MKRPKSIRIATFLFLLLAVSSQAANVDSIATPKKWLAVQNEIGSKLLKQEQEFKKAVTIFKSALDFANSKDLQDEFPELSIGHGIALYKNGDLQNSYATLIEVLPKIPADQLQMRAEINQILGMNLVFQDKFSEGYKYQMDALKYYSDMKDNRGLMSVYYDLGANFGSQEQYELALINYEKGLAIARASEDVKMIILGITSIGGTHASLKDFDKALKYSKQSIELAESINDNEELGWAAINRGYILGLQEEFDEAEFYLKKAYDLSFTIENQLLTAYALEQLADVYTNQNKLEMSIKSLGESYEIYKSIGQIQSVKSVIKKYADIAFKQKDFEKYKSYTDQYIAIKDSIYSKQMMEEMTSLKEGFEIHQLERENEIALLKKDQELRDAKNYATVGISLGAAGILILLLSLMYFRNKSEVEKNQILTEKNAEILRQMDILAASNQDLEKFAYIISHDLKEPLRNINGFTKLLTRNMRDDREEMNEYANFIIKGTKQMEELLSGLLEYSKLSANKSQKQLINTNEVLSNVIESMNIQITEKNCVVRTLDMPPIPFRQTQLSQVFQNLVANAVKFSKDSGNVISVFCEEKGNDFQFCVSDEGIGIAPDFLKSIFVVFQRLNNRGSYSGSGIGLATCKKIVEDHGGCIWVESTPGEGSQFYFTVPKVCQEMILPANENKPTVDRAEAVLS